MLRTASGFGAVFSFKGAFAVIHFQNPCKLPIFDFPLVQYEGNKSHFTGLSSV